MSVPPAQIWHSEVDLIFDHHGDVYLVPEPRSCNTSDAGASGKPVSSISLSSSGSPIGENTLPVPLANRACTPSFLTPNSASIVVRWVPDAGRFEPSSFTVNSELVGQRIKTRGIYGVLPIGRVSFLIYIQDRSPAGELPGGHMVHRISELSWVELPAPQPQKSPPLQPTGSSTMEASAIPQTFTPSSALPAVAPKTLKEYRRLLDLFCQGGGIGRLHLLVSFSTNCTVCETVREAHRSSRGRRSSSSSNGTPTQRPPSSISDSSGAAGDPTRTYHWNSTLDEPFFACRMFVPPVTRGTYNVVDISDMVSNGEGEAAADSLRYALFTRMAHRNAGTRYNRRGLDADGNAANSAESEVLVWTAEAASSFVMIRGSVPLIWQQEANYSQKPPVVISTDEEATSEAVSQHFAALGNMYNPRQLLCLNLLGAHSRSERRLSEKFATAVDDIASVMQRAANGSFGNRNFVMSPVCTFSPTYRHIDLGHMMKKAPDFSQLRDQLTAILQEQIDQFGYSLWPCSKVEGADSLHVQPPMRAQGGIMRVNCLDCLDRTNLCQFLMTEYMAPRLVNAVVESSSSLTLAVNVDQDAAWNPHRPAISRAWLSQGNVVAFAYTGRPALFSEVLLERRKPTIRGMFHDFCIGGSRMVHQNFRDGPKQDAISLLTRAHDPVPMARMKKNSSPFERRLTLMNFFVLGGLLVGLSMVSFNAFYFYMTEVFDWYAVFILLFWSVYTAAVLWKMKRDAHSYTSYPLLAVS